MRFVLLSVLVLVLCSCKKEEPKLTENYMEVDGKTYPLTKGYLAQEETIDGVTQYRFFLCSSDFKLKDPNTNFYEFSGDKGSYLVFTLSSKESEGLVSGNYLVDWGEADVNFQGIADFDTILLSKGMVKVMVTEESSFKLVFDFSSSKSLVGNIQTTFNLYKR